MPETPLAQVKIILVEPAGALNVGSVARVMKNMGLSQLVLVNPQCDRASPEARQMAVHAADILEAAQEAPSLPAALQGCQKAIATTGRDRTALTIPLESPRGALPWLLDLPPDRPTWQSALIFGREDRGLTKEELNYAQRFIRIPSTDLYPSLNLAQAVAVCCYELHMEAISSSPRLSTAPAALPEFPAQPFSELAPLEVLEGYYQQLEALLLKIGYLYSHTSSSRMEKFRRLFNRAYPSEAEVAMMRGILRQMEWALRRAAKPEISAKPEEDSEYSRSQDG
ncbi:MAG: RNA methyltransferase [Oscillatoriophycideae cyanobacterium NC_groundwater_1537_Pr4_S-0.65um_50_18]|nr:RNA methyltransferase [Oscillatoriophycideae cyanobacterium NC_groundwater_1537_Pr4_S-0.65um_50_18]